jgi:DNA-binding response OmpR family regulator
MEFDLMEFKNYSSKNILLIDDDADDSFFLSYALAKISKDFSLSRLDSDDQLVEAIETLKPYLIIIDFYLVQKNGIECLRKIKAHNDYKEIPVIIWSSFISVRDVVLATKEGAMDYLQKPSSLPEFVAKLERVLSHLPITSE